MKLDKVPRSSGRVISARTVAAIEATNNRRAVKALRTALRWALEEIGSDDTQSVKYENAASFLRSKRRLRKLGIIRKLLVDTIPRKIRGR